MTGPQAPRRRPWAPPRWLTALLAVLAIGSGAARVVLGSTLFERGFGVVLVVLGLTFVRELRANR